MEKREEENADSPGSGHSKQQLSQKRDLYQRKISVLVVTNNHVISNGNNFIVIYAQGGTAKAELVGAAPEFDLAVLKINEAVPATAG